MTVSNRIARAVGAALRWKLQPALLGLICPIDHQIPTTTRGTNWPIPDGFLTAGSSCVCAGAGEEIELELWLAESIGARVVLLDPTPRSLRYLQSLETPPNLEIVPMALWRCDGTLRLFAPWDPAHVSHSLEASDRESGYFDAAAVSLATVLADREIHELDLLKMNIEGAEYPVLDAIFQTAIRPRVIATTFEGGRAFRRAVEYVHRLDSLGYRLVARKGWVFTFVLSP